MQIKQFQLQPIHHITRMRNLDACVCNLYASLYKFLTYEWTVWNQLYVCHKVNYFCIDTVWLLNTKQPTTLWSISSNYVTNTVQYITQQHNCQQQCRPLVSDFESSFIIWIVGKLTHQTVTSMVIILTILINADPCMRSLRETTVHFSVLKYFHAILQKNITSACKTMARAWCDVTSVNHSPSSV